MAEGQGQLVLSHPLGLVLARPGSVPILQMRAPTASQILVAQGSEGNTSVSPESSCRTLPSRPLLLALRSES